MKPPIPTLLLAATLCTSALVTRPARAQYTCSNLYTYKVPIDFAGMSEQRRQLDASSQTNENTARKSVRGVRHTPKKALATTTYRESPAVSKRVLGRFASFVTRGIASKTEAEAVRRYFAEDTLGRWARQAAPDGLRRGDVADAMAAYFVANWRIVSGVTQAQPAQIRGARRQIAAILASNPAFAKTTGAQRQEMAEGYIYNQILQSEALSQVVASGDAALIQRFRAGRAASFQQEMGLDLRTVKLTNTGFAAK